MQPRNELVGAIDSFQIRFAELDFIEPATKREIAGRFESMKSQATALAESPIAESTFFKIAFAGVGDSAVKAGVAFSNGHGMEGGAEVCRMLSSGAQLLSYFGFVGGPMAVFIGEVLSLISTMLKVVKTEKSSLGKQLRHELVVLHAEEGIDLMAGVLFELEQQEATLSALEPNSASFQDIVSFASLSKGDAIVSLGATQASLLREDRQTYEIWPYLFEAYLLTSEQYLENFILAYTALGKMDEHGVIWEPTPGLPGIPPTPHFMPDHGVVVSPGYPATPPYPGAKCYIDAMNNMLERLRERYEFFIREVGPATIHHGTTWIISQETRGVMRRNIISTDTDTDWDTLSDMSKNQQYARLSVGPFERIWTVGSHDDVWTGHGKSVNWTNKIPGVIKAQNIFVVRQKAHVARSDVYTIEKGECYRRTWEEELIKDKKSGKNISSGKGKFIGEILDLNQASVIEGVHYRDVVATEIGRVFLFGKTAKGTAYRHFSPDWVQQDPQQPRVAELFPPESESSGVFADTGAGLPDHVGLSANKYNIYILTYRAIWFLPISELGKQEYALPWQKMAGPKLETPRDYTAIFAGDDGSLVLSVAASDVHTRGETSAGFPKSQLYVWDGESWRTEEWSWWTSTGATCVWTVPCRGWELFEAVKSLVEGLDLVKGLEKAKDEPEGPHVEHYWT